MSPEHSADETGDRDSSDSDDDAPPVPKRVLKVRPLSWRSDRFNKILTSLDRKWLRRTSEKARSMIKDRVVGEAVQCDAPDDVLDWMVKQE